MYNKDEKYDFLNISLLFKGYKQLNECYCYKIISILSCHQDSITFKSQNLIIKN